MSQFFAELMQQSMSRGVADALRVWTRRARRCCSYARSHQRWRTHCRARNPLTGGYPMDRGATSPATITSACGWRPRRGQEQLAARVQLPSAISLVAQSLVKANGLTTRASPPGSIPRWPITPARLSLRRPSRRLRPQGRRRRRDSHHEAGPCRTAGRRTGNEEATTRLRKVVDIDDSETGTVRLKRAVDKVDEMALDTASTKTTRIRG